MTQVVEALSEWQGVSGGDQLSIGKRITKAIEAMDANDPMEALYSICSAIDATATAEYGKSGRSTYKKFIHDNLDIITDIAFCGRKILNLNLGYKHARLTADANGNVPVQDIFYHVVRCGLLHTTRLPDDLTFSDEGKIVVDSGGTLVLPSALIYGLIVAVVVSPANCDERGAEESELNFGGFPIPINLLWGRRSVMLWLLEVRGENLRRSASKHSP